MEKFFNSSFMTKIQDFGQKLGSNKFLTSLQGAMMSLMGIIMIGAISQIIISVLGPTLLGLFSDNSSLYFILYLPYQFTMNSLAVWIVLLFSYNYSKILKMNAPIMNAIDALVCFLLVAAPLIPTKTGFNIDMTFLGSQGMFIGFLVVFISVRIEQFCAYKNIRIKMPDVVPQFLQDGFSSILPLFFSVVIFLCISSIVQISTHGVYTIASGFMALIATPLSALTSVPGMFILVTFGALLWTFGIHGTLIILPIIMPLSIQAAVSNAALHEAGKPLIFYPVVLFGAIGMVGGTGNTLPLALLGLKSKSQQIRAVSRISAIPGWFGINEPMTFGMPIMYNPILCIPYVLSVPTIMFFTYLGYKLGFLTPSWIAIASLLPMGFGSYLSTLKWKNAIWDYLMFIPALIIWYPFFKIYEKQLLEKEKKENL